MSVAPRQVATTVPNDLEAFFVPFTPNRAFKKAPRLIVRAKDMPEVDVILIEVPDEVGGYGAKGVGEIGCVATAGAVAGALHAYDGIRRFRLPMDDAPAAAPSVPKTRRRDEEF